MKINVLGITLEVSINWCIVGVIYVTKAFLPAMIAQKSGHIVTISSAASTYGTPKLADYVASKWAVFGNERKLWMLTWLGFAESMRLELQKLGHKYIETTVVCPYYINTGIL